MPQERSPGGSTILRYFSNMWAAPQTADPDELSQQFATQRDDVYKELFGEVKATLPEERPLRPRIEVRTYVRSGSRGAVYALVTSGMSDLAMRIPRNVGKDAPRRVELVFYCAEPRREYQETLRWVARFPHDQKTWLSFGHTVPNGDPPAPFWGSGILDTLLFMPTVVQRDATLSEKLVLGGDPVHFLWVVPLSTAECNLKLQNGFSAILDLFDKNKHPHVFDATRRSYV